MHVERCRAVCRSALGSICCEEGTMRIGTKRPDEGNMPCAGWRAWRRREEYTLPGLVGKRLDRGRAVGWETGPLWASSCERCLLRDSRRGISREARVGLRGRRSGGGKPRRAKLNQPPFDLASQGETHDSTTRKLRNYQ